MMNAKSKLIATLCVFAVVLAIVFFAFRTPDTDAEEMRAKYGGGDSRFVKAADGLAIHYRDQGCRDCPAIVLVHGSNASLHTFEPLIRELQDRYRLISYDQPGHGLTGPHPFDDYSARSMLQALDTVITTSGVERFALLGNSMGGWVSWRYALDNPDKLLALVLVNSSGAPPSPNAEKPKLYLGARIMQYSAGRFMAKHITPRAIIEKSVLANFVNTNLVTESMVDRYWELLRFPGNRRAAGLRALADREPHFGERLDELSVPTLILWGDKDQVTPVINAHTFDKLIPNSKMRIFPNVGHLAMAEAPTLTATAVDEFLNENKTESGR